MDATLKDQVRDYWDAASCGEVYAAGETPAGRFEAQARSRYELEPYLLDFARFPDGTGRDVLEIGVGMGADHVEWAKHHPRSLTGVDLTPRAIAHTRERLALYGYTSDLRVADAESLPFASNSFDLVYSWGVLHHSPDTPRAIQEVHRVLRPGGRTRIMIYHTYSLVGFMLWARYGLLRARPWRSLADIYAMHLESPGTKAYSLREGRAMFKDFRVTRVRSQLSFGDLLEGAVGQRHRGPILSLARALWPRRVLRAIAGGLGLYLLIEAEK